MNANLSRESRLGRRDWDAGHPAYVARQDYHSPIRLLADGLRRHAGFVPERDVVRGGAKATSGLADHPGYLGITFQGIIAIHAEGPLYQLDHGLTAALESLGSHTAGARFGSDRFCDGWTDLEIRWTRFWDCRSQTSGT
jgi:hypothetical protein